MIKARYVLSFIILITALLKIWGLNYDYPLINSSGGGDETSILAMSLKMLGERSLIVDMPDNYYPALLSYFYLPFIVLFLGLAYLVGYLPDTAAMINEVFLNYGFFVLLARVITIFFSLGSIYLVYHLAKILFDKPMIALTASWFWAISFIHTQTAHFARAWVPQTFFILLTLYFIGWLYQSRGRLIKNYLLSGISLAVSFGINLVGIFMYPVFVLIHFLKSRAQGWKGILLSRSFWLANLVLVFLMVFIYFLNPYGLNNYLDRLKFILGLPVSGDYVDYNPSYVWKLINSFEKLWRLEIVLTALWLPASLILWFKKRVVFYFLNIAILSYLLLMANLTGGAYPRYLLPVVPLLAISGAYFIDWLGQGFLKKNNIYLLLLVALLSGPSLYLNILMNQKLTLPSTYLQATQWIEANIPREAKILNIDLGQRLGLMENKDVIASIKKRQPELFSSRHQYLLNLSKEKYPQPNYFIVHSQATADETMKFDYIVLGSFYLDDLIKHQQTLPESARLIQSFAPLKSTWQKTKFEVMIDNIVQGPGFLRKFTSRHSEAGVISDLVNWLDLIPSDIKKVERTGPQIEIYKI